VTASALFPSPAPRALSVSWIPLQGPGSDWEVFPTALPANFPALVLFAQCPPIEMLALLAVTRTHVACVWPLHTSVSVLIRFLSVSLARMETTQRQGQGLSCPPQVSSPGT
jgi:hypothetical protein